ncbi:hypothetical protein GGQ86_000390 [Xanthobacter flavus]|uniref:Uncharacterized protein n=1 Tax=Xanthobacter flavus TaxID=281 RepID=A0A9W6FQ16_XANFL|nr:hypothetical protein [Xanthobacter flavus]MDR6331943.1 hypothetical protein [Xanthobacter flavus]GLI25623.1 hypothetical protein XFLAVUS301_52970 [Xanthobacter flavus]
MNPLSTRSSPCGHHYNTTKLGAVALVALGIGLCNFVTSLAFLNWSSLGFSWCLILAATFFVKFESWSRRRRS